MYTQQNHRTKLESIFEEVRADHYPDLPSRLEAIFICDSLSDLQNFHRTAERTLDICYEVKLIDTDAPILKTDWDLAGLYETDTTDVLHKKAHQYWQAKNIKRPEILTLSPVQIVKRLS
ncbi:MAG: DUF2441 domain-containing protein [Fulvivirga sp.]